MKWVNYPFKMEKQYRKFGWDYSKNGYYFVTICTKDRINYFGEIVDDEIYLSEIGAIVNKYWIEMTKHFSNVELDKFTVMPNHFHGIIIINRVGGNRSISNYVGSNMPWHVPTIKNEIQINEFSKPISNSISMMINHFKGSVKRECNKNNIKFDWQTRFHDRIIRSEKEYWAKRIYTENNPKNWEKDIEHIW